MNITNKFEEITSYQGDNFKKWFGNMEYKNEESKLYSKKLDRLTQNIEILNSLKPTELSLGEVFNYLNSQANKLDWMIFYCKDFAGVLRTVFVRWGGGGWVVYARSVVSPYVWDVGHQVFSRNSFDSMSPQTLESRVKALEEWKEHVINSFKK